ncbi:MAG: enolase C-terminal domain-like protein [Geminicoccaceae bacterium]
MKSRSPFKASSFCTRPRREHRSGDWLCTIVDFARLVDLRAADVGQPDVAHCGGMAAAKKITALAAMLHVALPTPNMPMLESFTEFDVDRRDDLAGGWSLFDQRTFSVPEKPGLGLELDRDTIAAHPDKPLAFPSLWNMAWHNDFTGTATLADTKK